MYPSGKEFVESVKCEVKMIGWAFCLTHSSEPIWTKRNSSQTQLGAKQKTMSKSFQCCFYVLSGFFRAAWSSWFSHLYLLTHYPWGKSIGYKKRKLTGYAVLGKIRTSWNCCLLEVGKMEELDFGIEIYVIHPPCGVTQPLQSKYQSVIQQDTDVYSTPMTSLNKRPHFWCAIDISENWIQFTS